MLRVTYTGGDAPQHWLFDPDDVDFDEAERIETAMGTTSRDTWDQFVAGVMDAKVRARRVLLWHLLRRTNPDYPMPFSETPNAKMGQLTVELGTAEIATLANRIEAAPLTPAAKASALQRLTNEFDAASAAESTFPAGDVTADPKDATAAVGTTPAAEHPETPPTALTDPSVVSG